MPQGMSDAAAGVCCAVLHDHHNDPPDSALALRFPGAANPSPSVCREKHRNLRLVIPPQAAIAIVMISGPGFELLCNSTKSCFAN